MTGLVVLVVVGLVAGGVWGWWSSRRPAELTMSRSWLARERDR